MKFFAYLLVLLSAVMSATAVDVQKSFLVSFAKDAPDSAVAQASTFPPLPVFVRKYHPRSSLSILWTESTSLTLSTPTTEQKIIDAKGTITHEYTLIKGFAATAGEKVYESMQVWTESIGATIEEDQNVQVNGGNNNRA